MRTARVVWYGIALALACAFALVGCKTDLGAPGNFLPCDAEGQCATGFRCAQTELGAVCLNEAQWQERCGNEESCNGRDDNCDGAIDEDFDGTGESCSIGTGTCVRNGVTICDADGTAIVCGAVVGSPTDEICDGLDNDCDGETDEDLEERIIGSDIGMCVPRIERCAEGSLIVVDVGIEPTDEICDGLDNDCDGETDDGVPPLLIGSALGVCELSISECVGGMYVVTQAGVDPISEKCDGFDDDCDGETDEDYSELGSSCDVGVGVCAASGTTVCSDDGGTTCDAVAGTPSTELCDGLDNDCNGSSDEVFVELGEACSLGIGACLRNGVRACRADGFGTTCDAVPGMPTSEICDGLDNDCDGRIDEDLADGCCIPGIRRSCGTDIGACEVGEQVCGGDRAWGACNGTGPVAESCDNIDNDCDGSVDEALVGCCVPGTTVVCSIDRGACVAGQQLCDGETNTWLDCDGILPVSESCNGFDDNCDGTVDEIFPRLGESCTVGIGACAVNGEVVCTADGITTECSATAGVASDEICDGLDNDCDGAIDEELVVFSGSDLGACQQGIRRCIDAAWVVVQVEVVPADEICDGLDNDCDGAIDEDAPACCEPGMTRTCGFARGECRTGLQRCSAERSWSECSGTLPQPERCDGLDNDCDGVTDDEWALLLDRPCTIGYGICLISGVNRCAADGSGAVCSSDDRPASPADEICDGLDNDCDGRVDEPEDVRPRVTGSDVGRCRPQIEICLGGSYLVIQEPIGSSPEVCNGLDDDCNTVVDNVASVPCYEGPDGTEGIGICRRGATSCVGGMTRCVGQVIPSSELCNNRDDDCDGITDGSLDAFGNPAPLMDACYTGPPESLDVGMCVAGTTTCRSGRWGACIGEVTPTGLGGNCGTCAGLLALGVVGSGVQTIATSQGPLDVYCDMTTDGGGWTLVLAYAHPGGANDPLVIGAPPTNPDIGYSHMSARQLQSFSLSELRFYCETSAHERRIHFKTSNPSALDYIVGDAVNVVAAWNQGFESLLGHAGYLPERTDEVHTARDDERMTDFPFWTSGSFHWGVRGFGYRWECDDYPDGFQNVTLHQVWVR